MLVTCSCFGLSELRAFYGTKHLASHYSCMALLVNRQTMGRLTINSSIVCSRRCLFFYISSNLVAKKIHLPNANGI